MSQEWYYFLFFAIEKLSGEQIFRWSSENWAMGATDRNDPSHFQATTEPHAGPDHGKEMPRREMGGGRRITVVSNCKKISLTNIKSKTAYYDTITCSIEIFLMLYENIKLSLFFSWHNIANQLVCMLSCIWLFVTPCISLPDSSVHGIAQARKLEWTAVPSYRGIFLAQGSNPCLLPLLHWQVDSLPLPPPGKPWESTILQ